MEIRSHLRESLRFENTPSPWPRMILSGMTVSMVLTIGYFRHEMAVSILGGLFSFLLLLNDHFGPLRQRIAHLLVCFLFLISGFYVGLLFRDNFLLILITLFALAFATGKSKGLGLELERLLLFTTLQFLTGAFSSNIRGNFLQPLFYVSFAFMNYIICLCVVYLVMRHAPNFHQSKRKELREAMKRKETNRYSYTLAAMCCLGLMLANYFEVERGYWVVGTTLIVMLPDRRMSFHRSFQRLVGTIIGVVIGALVVKFRRDPLFLIGFSGIFAFGAPYGLFKNYWLGNVFVAALILFLLEISSVTPHGDFSLAIERIIDIGAGCLLGVLGTLISGPLKPRVV